jgi:hypothetical protein
MREEYKIFNLNFCNLIQGFEHKEQYVYKLPWEFYKLEHIMCDNSMFPAIHFKVNDDNANLRLYVSMYSKVMHINYNILCRYMHWDNEHLIKGTNKLRLGYEGLIKGIYLENIDIESIASIKFLRNGIDIVNYGNKIMISLYAKKVADNCYYICYDNEEHNNLNLLKTRNHWQIDNFVVEIKSDVEQDIVVHAIDSNILHDVIWPKTIEQKAYSFKVHEASKLIPYTANNW